MTSERRRVTAVVVTHDSRPTLGELAATLEEGMAGLDWRLAIVDNASRDDSARFARELFPDAEIIESSENRGFAAGVNLAAQQAAPKDDLLILNHDVTLAPGAGREMIAALRRPASRDLTVGIAVPRLSAADGALAPSLRREPLIRRVLAETILGVRRACLAGLGEAVMNPEAYERETEADWGTGAALAISAECRAASGPWDESFFLYSEECEYCLRARGHGYVTRLAPKASVTHSGTASRADPDRWRLLVLNKLELYRRRHGRVLGELFRIASIARELRLAATGNAPSRPAAMALIRPAGLYGMSSKRWHTCK